MRVISAVGFLVAAMIANALKNYELDALAGTDASRRLVNVVAWQSVALLVVAFVSVELFRTKLPKAVPSVPVSHVESSLP